MPEMTDNRVQQIDGRVTQGPWIEPVRSALPVPTDPRLELSENALVVASQNAFPIVARQQTRRDSLGLAAGGAIALVLGAATFISLSSSRHAPAVPATAAATSQTQSALPAPPMTAGRPVAMPMPGMAAPTAPQAAAMAGAGPQP